MATRVILVAVGLLAVLWGGLAGTDALARGTWERVAYRITMGDPFKPEALALLQAEPARGDGDSNCDPSAARSRAIVSLRIVEEALANGMTTSIDPAHEALDAATTASLTCSPADPLLWVVLYWEKNTRHGFQPENLALLSMSYASGPREGWIARRRSALAFSAYESLPRPLQVQAEAEFVGLASSWFQSDAAALIAGPAWKYRHELLEKLEGVPERARHQFSRALRREGLDLDVPGIPRADARPWR